MALAAMWLVPTSAAAQSEQRAAAAEQVLTWTGSNSTTEYASAPATAVAGPTTIVFENSTATGNTIGMPHTLTFDTSNPAYNQDVDLNIVANPFDSNGGRHEVEVTLSPGEYRYYCDIPGHGEMSGVLVVTGGGEDTTPPEVSAELSGDQDADGNYVGSATVAITAQDADSGVDTIEYEIDDTGFQPYTGPVTVDQPGDHAVQYRATDNAGNTSEVGSVPFTVVEPDPGDTTPPVVSAQVSGDQDADGNYVGSADVAVTAQDAGSGVDTVEYDLDGAGFQAYTGPVQVTEVGQHTVSYRATDNAGNTSEVGSVSFTVVEPDPGDTTPPEVSAEVSGDQDADGNYVGSATVTITAQDADSGVDTVEYDLDGAGFQAYTGPVTIDEPGHHMVGYRATDNAGNTSEVGSVMVMVVEPVPDDTTPPEVSAAVAGDQDADGNFVGSATVTLSATDAESGVASVSYALDDGSFGPYTAPFAVDEPGEHTVQYRATDNSGNTSELGSISFTVVEPDPGDTTPPEVSAAVAGDQDADGNYVGSATVTITAQDADSGVDTVSYALDDGSYGPYTAPFAVDEPGEHTVSYRATDNAGNTSELGSISFTVVEPDPGDTTPPEVSAAASGDQDDDGNYVGSVTITVTAQDADSGVDTVEYDLDSGGFQAYTAPVVITDPGEHILSYRATDNAGNTSEIASVIVTVVEPDPGDITPPEVSAAVAGDQDDDGNYVGSATVTITAQDADSGIESVSYALDDGSFGPYTGPIEVTDAGEHTVSYRATDNAGNTSELASVTFTVVAPDPGDTTPPEVSAAVAGDQDADGNYVGTATVTITAQDADSGVDTVEYDLDGSGFQAYTGPIVVSAAGEHTVSYRATDNSDNASELGSVTFVVVESDSDACPGSDTRDTVIIGTIDTTVANVDTGDGCTISDLIDADGEHANHGKFVKHVREVANALAVDGLISDSERGRLLSAAARSDISR